MLPGSPFSEKLGDAFSKLTSIGLDFLRKDSQRTLEGRPSTRAYFQRPFPPSSTISPAEARSPHLALQQTNVHRVPIIDNRTLAHQTISNDPSAFF